MNIFYTTVTIEDIKSFLKNYDSKIYNRVVEQIEKYDIQANLSYVSPNMVIVGYPSKSIGIHIRGHKAINLNSDSDIVEGVHIETFNNGELIEAIDLSHLTFRVSKKKYTSESLLQYN